MKNDVFISYSRLDNQTNRISEFKKVLETEYFKVAEEKLNCFFDTEDIKIMENWKFRLQDELKHSHLFLQFLSPNYLKSKHCEMEIVEFLKYEYARGTQGDGVAQVCLIELGENDKTEYRISKKEWIKRLGDRQYLDFCAWFNEGFHSLEREEILKNLKELINSMHQRISKMRVIVNFPGNLHAPNPRFVGRGSEMEILHKSLWSDKFGVLTAVHGMGGLGKTAIAFQYTYAYADFYPGGRWQIGCANETDLAAVLKKLDLDLKVTFTEEEKKDDLRGAKRILNELEALAFKGVEAATGDREAQKPAVLLLLDNVDHAELLQLPDVGLISGKPWLKVLVTTRMGPEELGADETKQTLLTIDELPFEDALSLIESYQPHGRFKTEEEKVKAGEIVDLLGCFTLAVEVAALYLSERDGQITCADFLELLKRKGNLEGIDFAGDKTISDTAIYHTKLITATLSPTLDLLSLAETLVLSYAALLPPDSIPLPWIKTLVAKDFPELGKPVEIGEDDPWLLIVNHLLSLRLLQIVDFDGPTPRIVRSHRFIQELMQKRYSNTKAKMFISIFNHGIERSQYLEKHWQYANTQWEIGILVKIIRIGLNSKDQNVIPLLTSICEWFNHFDDGQIAEELLTKAIKIIEGGNTPNNEQLVIVLSDLGHSLCNQGRWNKALPIFKRAIECEENLKGNHSVGRIVRLLNYGAALHKTGDLLQAKIVLQQAMNMAENTKGVSPYILGSTINNLAVLLQEMRQFKEAEVLHRKGLLIDEKHFGSNHPIVAGDLFNLGKILQNTGRKSEALINYSRAYKIYVDSLPINHPDTLVCLKTLSKLLKKVGLGDETEDSH